jgi:hypothetical protein
MDPTKEQHQIMCKSRKKCDGNPGNKLDLRLGGKVRAIHEKSKLMETEKGEAQSYPMLIILFDIKEIVYKEFVLAGQSVPHTTMTFYSDYMKMCEDFAGNFSNKITDLHHNNPQSHTSFFTWEFLTKNSIVIPHPPSFSLFTHN